MNSTEPVSWHTVTEIVIVRCIVQNDLLFVIVVNLSTTTHIFFLDLMKNDKKSQKLS
jgi:hypothetical protein